MASTLRPTLMKNRTATKPSRQLTFSQSIRQWITVRSSGCSLCHPDYVWIIRNTYQSTHRLVSDFWDSVLPKPFVNLRVSIGERQTTRPIMVAGRNINPFSCAGGRPKRHGHAAIINTVGMFIQEDP